MLKRALDRVTEVALEAANATAVRVLRIVGSVATALGRAVREVSELARDYQDVVGDLRRAGSRKEGFDSRRA